MATRTANGCFGTGVSRNNLKLVKFLRIPQAKNLLTRKMILRGVYPERSRRAQDDSVRVFPLLQ